MSKEQKCILCEIVYSSKQEMEEHMRSMLHHRELGILKGRDCRHECRVCGVTTSSLTEYASHISSFQHKQRVDDQKRKPVKEGKAEEYFDKETVKLIEERKEMRKEETFQRQADDKQEHWQELPNNRPLLSLPYPPFPPMQNSAMGRNWQNVRFPSQNPNQWFGPRCATWHGEGPPDMQMWQSSGRRGKFWGAYDAQPQQPRKRFPWNNGQFDFPWEGPIASHTRRHKSPRGKQKRPFNISDYQYLSFEESSEKRNFYKNHQTSAQGREYTRHQPTRLEKKTPDKDYQNAHNSTKDAQITFENNCQLNIPDHPSQGNDLKKQQSFKSGGSSSVGRLTNSSHFTSRTNVEDHNLSEILQKAKETLLERTNSIPENHFKGTKPMTRTEDPQHIEPAASAFTNSSESKIRPTKRMVQKEQAHLSSSNEHLTPINISVQTGLEPKNTRPSLQSLQVSTSTMDQGDEKACAQIAATNQPVEDQDMNGSPSHPTTGSSVSTLGTLSLPASLKRDLNRHMSTKGKALAHEPNLNSARRIRTVSETRKSDPEKDSALKPNLRQLLNSSSSRRGVNWNQVYHEVNRNKQGKGLPRFGIEMVPCEPEGLNQMDESELLSEGFQWDTVIDVDQITSCNQSLIESSTTGVNGAFGTNSHPQFDSRRDSVGCGTSQDRTQEVDSGIQSLETSKDLMDLEVGEITSDAELNDTQGSGMKRRAAGDVVASGIPNEVRKNKRQKIKKRSQVNQLMTLSLREEELSSSLQSMDNSLIQARAALESAYLEVQRLLMVKQQVTAEMSSLRTKRIEILHGMQGEFESPERETIAETQTLQISNTSKPHQVSSNITHPPSAPPLLPSATVPVLARIKQEPKSVFEASLEANLSKNPISDIQTTTSVQTVFGSCQTEITAIMPESVQETSSLPVSSHKRSSFLESKQSSQEKPAETRVKQVQKRKKRKCFKKATGAEEPELSESELDAERSSRPIRKIRHSRRSSGTSSSHSTLNEKDHMQMQASESPTVQPQKDTKPAAKIVTRDSDSSELEMMDLPPPAPTDFVNLVSSDPEDGSPSKLDKMSTTTAPLPIDPKNLACNEVTSTSEINSSAAVSACESQRKSASVATDSKGPSEASDAEEEELPTEGEFEGHLEAVHGMQIHNGLLYTCSGDRTIRAFNIIDRKCVAVFRGHSSKVNCLLLTSGVGLMQRLYSGSSDQTIRCYNLKSTECVEQLSLPDRVLCLHSRWTILYVGLANGFVTTFSLKTNKQLDVFECHGPRAVSCLATAQEGSRHVLLVGSYDATISVRDATNGLLLRTLEGHTKTVLCMKVVNDLVFSGSSDQSVHAHNIHTGELVRIYKGHSHAVTVVAILGKVMVTACLDKLIRVYELQSHDRLQVYGGHSDMVMCMLIHKSMIYTGCYDGSVKAVKLNLIQNYRCWWHGCTLIFGVMEHLKQHLLNQHICPTQQMFKCRWRNCDTFFMRNQAVLSHMHKHVEDDSKMEP